MRNLLRAVLVILLLFFAGFFILGYWTAGPTRSDDTIGTSGAADRDAVRERGADLGEKAAVATAKVQETVSEAAVTAKIKAKMALDDLVKARAIDVSTNDSIVTVSGTVDSPAEHDRAIALARETDGVTRVVDRLVVR
jgi:hyperosmotically inducible protein